MAYLSALLLPLALLGLATLSNIRHGLNLGDEGYLVYGTQAVLRGEVPIRDFRAYDPARYYWCALWCRLLGPGILTVRVSMAVVQAGSLALIVLVVGHATNSAMVAALAGCVSLCWMFPRHKQIEIFFSIVCCGAMYALVLGIGSGFALGVLGAIELAFGLNILVYLLGATALVALSGALATPFAAALDVIAGLTVGGAVLLVLTSRVSGFLSSYLDRKVFALFRRGTTNLALPKPWVWATTPQFRHYGFIRRGVLKAVFTLIPVASVAAIAILALSPSGMATESRALALASACAGLAYFHHAFSRADLPHFAQIIHPMVILAAASGQAFLGAAGASVVLLALLLASIGLLREEAEFPLHRLLRRRAAEPGVASNGLVLPRATDETLKRVKAIVDEWSGADDTLFAAPACPGFLALFERRTAVYDTFPVYPSSPEGRAAMMTQFRAAAPPVAIVSAVAIDRREELAFANNYPELMAYILANYEVALETGSESVYVRRQQDPE
ncbi:hypothetical protein DFR52_104346 [Hoeflea marina]|uniref:4-amino-4-deoxy-L-arabinose transferase-like glycosyltransferase n=1 Tax=Hoeflea marina TaxID=274592 RepID=A0A317PG82_9HYPH|nr:hypothetical protein [Hoeflea marina]PWV99055.1 hypothetical protein DFR52_104346 [Hoeflea marina]